MEEKIRTKNKEELLMPKTRNPYTGKMITVSSLVPYAGRSGGKRTAYCARTAKIRGNWKTNPNSKNLVQRRRWKCRYVKGELRI